MGQGHDWSKTVIVASGVNQRFVVVVVVVVIDNSYNCFY